MARLKNQLQGELDLPRIVRRIARGPDFAEVGACKVSRIANRNNTVAAEIWRVEVRVVEDIEDFRSELQSKAFRDQEVFKQRIV